MIDQLRDALWIAAAGIGAGALAFAVAAEIEMIAGWLTL